MQSFIQYCVGCAVMFGAAPFLYETPFNHWMVYLPLFVGGMYATAVVQHWRHQRRLQRLHAPKPPLAYRAGVFVAALHHRLFPRITALPRWRR